LGIWVLPPIRTQSDHRRQRWRPPRTRPLISAAQCECALGIPLAEGQRRAAPRCACGGKGKKGGRIVFFMLPPSL
jgi:hypothetical protein